MHTATEIGSQQEHRFRSLDNLARRLGGTTWSVEHDPAHDPPRCTVEILRRVPQKGDPDSYTVVVRVRVPSEALPPRSGT